MMDTISMRTKLSRRNLWIIGGALVGLCGLIGLCAVSAVVVSMSGRLSPKPAPEAAAASTSAAPAIGATAPSSSEWGCDLPGLTAAERANCGPHGYDVTATEVLALIPACGVEGNGQIDETWEFPISDNYEHIGTDSYATAIGTGVVYVDQVTFTQRGYHDEVRDAWGELVCFYDATIVR